MREIKSWKRAGVGDFDHYDRVIPFTWSWGSCWRRVFTIYGERWIAFDLRCGGNSLRRFARSRCEAGSRADYSRVPSLNDTQCSRRQIRPSPNPRVEEPQRRPGLDVSPKATGCPREAVLETPQEQSSSRGVDRTSGAHRDKTQTSTTTSTSPSGVGRRVRASTRQTTTSARTGAVEFA